MREEKDITLTEQLRYSNYDIVFQEVPNETTLALNITECPHRCAGCHSPHLSDSVGRYVNDDIDDILGKYKGYITCVCFMGGDQKIGNLEFLLKKVKNEYRLKTCVYSGVDNSHVFDDLIPYLDYLKIGHYDSRFGGLDSPITNQVFYKINEDQTLIDMTKLFRK